MSKFRKIMAVLLNEAKQVGTLYHGISNLRSALAIIRSNSLISEQFLWSIAPGISTTRSKHLWFGPIQLVLDGDKISNNYKISPYSEKFVIPPNYNANGDEKDEMDDEFSYDITNPPRYTTEYPKDFKWHTKGTEYEELITPKRQNGQRAWKMPVLPYLKSILINTEQVSFEEITELNKCLHDVLPEKVIPFYDKNFKEIKLT